METRHNLSCVLKLVDFVWARCSSPSASRGRGRLKAEGQESRHSEPEVRLAKSVVDRQGSIYSAETNQLRGIVPSSASGQF